MMKAILLGNLTQPQCRNRMAASCFVRIYIRPSDKYVQFDTITNPLTGAVNTERPARKTKFVLLKWIKA